MLFKIQSNLLSAVEAACANPERDSRAHIWGWHIDTIDEPVLVATNGAILLTVPITVLDNPKDDEKVPGVIMPVNVPATKIPRDIWIDTVEMTATIGGKSPKDLKRIGIKEPLGISHSFPSWRVAAGRGDAAKASSVSELHFNPEILAGVTKALAGKEGELVSVGMHITDGCTDTAAPTPLRLTFGGFPAVKGWFMLCRG